jgi:acyl carrier protein
MDIATRVTSVLQSVAGKRVSVDEDESLFDSGVLDSFALPELVSALEEEFEVKIPDSELNPRKFETIARISEYIESKM